MRNVTVTEVPADAQLIDVREDDEYAIDHAAGTVHLPMSELAERLAQAGQDANDAPPIDPDRDIYVICKSGGRSFQVCQYLEHAYGWDTINVDGGTDAWRTAGLPMES